MHITRKEFINGLINVLEGEGLTINLNLTSKIMDHIDSFMVPKPVPVKIGNRNGLDIFHDINKFREVHKSCEG